MTKTVLIVEDNELNMKLFNDLVETRGCAIIQTRSGVEAVDLARKHRPDLILMDIQLPEISGLQVTQWLKDDENLKAIPIIAVTAFAMKGDEEKIRQGGCEAYLSKPISVGKFLEKRKAVLRLVLEENSQVLNIPGEIVRVEPVEGRRDITLAALRYDDAAVPHAYKLRINDAIRLVKEKPTPAAPSPQTSSQG